MEGELFLPSFRKLKFVDCNRPLFRRLMYLAFRNAKRMCDKWGDYQMHVGPYRKDSPFIVN